MSHKKGSGSLLGHKPMNKAETRAGDIDPALKAADTPATEVNLPEAEAPAEPSAQATEAKAPEAQATEEKTPETEAEAPAEPSAQAPETEIPEAEAAVEPSAPAP
ncbi:MAG: hypothetical protein JW718_08795, partial [Desulfovibrionaceae bacterium]|nr:hypothetical protein [Desulfovibrionaceae bacterium]